MKAKTLERRSSSRHEIVQLEVASISSLENLAKIARAGVIVDASKNGFLMQVKREDLVPKALRQNLNIDSVIGTKICLYLPQMNLEISGIIKRTKLMGKKGYEIGVDFSDDAPEYWRECLLDLLPRPGELD